MTDFLRLLDAQLHGEPEPRQPVDLSQCRHLTEAECADVLEGARKRRQYEARLREALADCGIRPDWRERGR